jgi:DNA-binding NarL/FixJ family response regulator
LGKASIRVFVVDDYKAWRSFHSTALQKKPELEVIGQVSDGLEAVQQAQQLQPDLILLDIGLPSLNGIEAARQIRIVSPASKILFVSENRSPDIVNETFTAGGWGYVVKSDAATELLPAVDAVLEGKRFLSRSLASYDLTTSPTEASAGERRIEENPYLLFAKSESISGFLASIVDAAAADCGSLQLFDSSTDALRLVACHGFESDFLSRFNKVDYKSDTPCSRAMIARSRVVVTDVANDPRISTESRTALLGLNVRSCQSTPLIDPQGRLIGMVSTHCARVGTPSTEALGQVDNLVATLVANINKSGQPAQSTR